MYHSIIRTVVPLVVALVLGQAARIGLDLDEGAVTSILTALVGAAYYALARWLAETWPAAGRVLPSAGLSKRAPEYVRTRQTPTRTPPPSTRRARAFRSVIRPCGAPRCPSRP
ncbi:hypothetical protein Acsp03_61960 [Actinomadura sp. NBRC 104412]|nr:hypothetical protein Acsp03_61960 [Actinomadura sp. NBRC 104412]